MACGLQSRLPTAETRRLWNEMKILNDTLSECVETAEAYLRALDVRVARTKKYFSDVRGRLSGIPTGNTVIDEDVRLLMCQDEETTKEHFSQMRSEAAEGFEQVTRERSQWMDETTRLIGKQMAVLSNIDIRIARHRETLRLRARILKTFQDILNVEGEVRNLQKVLYDCEVGKVELEEDFVVLLKIFQELNILERKTSEMTEAGESTSEQANPDADAAKQSSDALL